MLFWFAQCLTSLVWANIVLVQIFRPNQSFIVHNCGNGGLLRQPWPPQSLALHIRRRQHSTLLRTDHRSSYYHLSWGIARGFSLIMLCRCWVSPGLWLSLWRDQDANQNPERVSGFRDVFVPSAAGEDSWLRGALGGLEVDECDFGKWRPRLHLLQRLMMNNNTAWWARGDGEVLAYSLSCVQIV